MIDYLEKAVAEAKLAATEATRQADCQAAEVDGQEKDVLMESAVPNAIS